MTERLGRADLHIHTLASDGTAGVVEILDHVERNTELDVIAITDHERIDAALAGRAIARDRGPALRGRRRRGGHDPRRPPARAVDRAAGEAVPNDARHDRGDPRPGRHRDPGASARALPAVRPGLRAPPAARRRAALPAGRDRGVQPDDARPAVARPRGPLRRGARRRPRGQLGRPRPRPRSGSATRRSQGTTAPRCGPRSPPARRTTTGRSTRPARSSRRSGRSCGSTAATPGRASAAGCDATARGATSATRPSTGPSIARRTSAGERRVAHARARLRRTGGRQDDARSHHRGPACPALPLQGRAQGGARHGARGTGGRPGIATAWRGRLRHPVRSHPANPRVRRRRRHREQLSPGAGRAGPPAAPRARRRPARPLPCRPLGGHRPLRAALPAGRPPPGPPRRRQGGRARRGPRERPLQPLDLAIPTVVVATDDGYDPGLEDILAFLTADAPAAGRLLAAARR